MTNILHIIGSLDRGGAEKILQNIVQHSTKEFAHLVVSLTADGESVNDMRRAGATVIELRVRTVTVEVLSPQDA